MLMMHSMLMNVDFIGWLFVVHADWMTLLCLYVIFIFAHQDAWKRIKSVIIFFVICAIGRDWAVMSQLNFFFLFFLQNQTDIIGSRSTTIAHGTIMFCWGSTVHGELGLGGIEQEYIFAPKEHNFKYANSIAQGEFILVLSNSFNWNLLLFYKKQNWTVTFFQDYLQSILMLN